MIEETKCSIITVAYNSAQTIKRTIESVLNQTYKNIEYIIVDGASKDDTVAIVQGYEKDFDGRLKWVSEPDEGLYYAMNKGIDMATGSIIGIINSDDWYEPDAVENMVKLIEDMCRDNSTELVVAYGALKSWLDDVEQKVTVGDHTRIREAMIGHPTCFVTKALYDRCGVFDTKYISAADYDLILRFSENPDVYFAKTEKIIANFSLGGMCSSGKAYYDLLKVQKAHGIISAISYAITVMKCRIYDTLHK